MSKVCLPWFQHISSTSFLHRFLFVPSILTTENAYGKSVLSSNNNNGAGTNEFRLTCVNFKFSLPKAPTRVT